MNFPVMSADNFLERAEHYPRAKETADDTFTRHLLERMERSYRVLAASESALAASQEVEEELSNRHDGQDTSAAVSQRPKPRKDC